MSDRVETRGRIFVSSHIRPIVLVGPTAGGKSELAVALAERLSPRGQIINADSMQVYRHMEAGTAKPSRLLRDRMPHHLIDIVEPTERFTVADWISRAEPLIAQLQTQQQRPIIVGGTNLYLRGLLEGMFEGPDQDAEYRATLSILTPHELHARLQKVDPRSAERIHPNDQKKLVRALEVHHLTGQPLSSMQTQWESFQSRRDQTPQYRHDPILLGLDWPVEAINRRINSRVKEMFFPTDPAVESLPAETRRLKEAGLLGPQASEALGYKQVLDHLSSPSDISLDDAFEKTKILTRRFAKSQRTWLKRFQGVTWLPADELPAEELTAKALAAVQ